MFNDSRRNVMAAAGAIVFSLGIVGTAEAAALGSQPFRTFENTVDTDENAVAGEGTNEIIWGLLAERHTLDYKFEGLSLSDQDITEVFLTLENRTNTASLHGQFQTSEPVEISEPQSTVGILAFSAVALASVFRRNRSSKSAEV